MKTHHSLLVRASAGTGKTYQLTGRLLSILTTGSEISSILATTFTRKAAGEILDRILSTLATAATSESGLASLRAQVGDENISQAQCRLLLHRIVRDIHRVRICTLDSLFSQLARSFPFELQLPPGWRLTDEIEESWLRQRALRATIASLEEEQLLTLVAMLSKGKAVRSIDFELESIVTDGFQDARRAQPSAWKSLRSVSPPDQAELDRATAVLRNADVKHKLANDKLRNVAEVLDSDDCSSLVDNKAVGDAANLAPAETLTYYRKEVSGDLLDALRTAHQAAKSLVIERVKLQTEATGEILQAYAEHIDSIKQNTRALAFDDVAFRLANWIDSLDLELLSQRLDASITHVLLDEFQDTAPVQWSVLKPLALRSTQETSDHSFFCVGDTKQAIYGWRGGRAAIFETVKEQLPGIEDRSQDKSFRSSPLLCEFVTKLFQHLDQHPKFSGGANLPAAKEDFESNAVADFCNTFPRHESAKPQLPGYVVLETAPKSEATGAGATEIKNQIRLEHAALRISALASSATGRSIGVLTRTNATVGKIIQLLKHHGVDVSQEGGNPLTDSPVVELILSTLRLAEHPADFRWAYHVSHSPLCKLLKLSPWKSRSGEKKRNEQISNASDLVRGKVEVDGLSATIRWLGNELIPHCGPSDAVRLRQLVALAQGYEQNPQPRLHSFVELVETKRVDRPQPAQVRVMTIHQAKGLEFDAVVLPELDGNLVRRAKQIIARSESAIAPPQGLLRYVNQDKWNLLPRTWQRAFGQVAADAMRESLCLLYVAVTRARHALHMIIDPATKPEFTLRTPASLIFHAVCSEGVDPSVENATLYEVGDRHWMDQLPDSPVE